MIDQRIGDSEETDASDSPVRKGWIEPDPIRLTVLTVCAQLPSSYEDVAAIFYVDPPAQIVIDCARTNPTNPSAIRVRSSPVHRDIARRVYLDPHTDSLDCSLGTLNCREVPVCSTVDVLQYDSCRGICAVTTDREIPDYERLREIGPIDEYSHAVDLVNRPGTNDERI